MKRPAEAAREQHRPSGPPKVRPLGRQDPASTEDLSDQHKKMLDCLQGAKAGLTAKQLESSLEWPPEAVEAALAELMARDLVSQLNTIIPSYLCRYPGVRLYT